jgi:hypothetical protein
MLLYRDILAPKEKIVKGVALETQRSACGRDGGFKNHFFCLAKRNGFWIPKKRRFGKSPLQITSIDRR